MSLLDLQGMETPLDHHRDGHHGGHGSGGGGHDGGHSNLSITLCGG